jgi:hypothetical protein
MEAKSSVDFLLIKWDVEQEQLLSWKRMSYVCP